MACHDALHSASALSESRHTKQCLHPRNNKHGVYPVLEFRFVGIIFRGYNCCVGYCFCCRGAMFVFVGRGAATCPWFEFRVGLNKNIVCSFCRGLRAATKLVLISYDFQLFGRPACVIRHSYVCRFWHHEYAKITSLTKSYRTHWSAYTTETS